MRVGTEETAVLRVPDAGQAIGQFAMSFDADEYFGSHREALDYAVGVWLGFRADRPLPRRLDDLRAVLNVAYRCAIPADGQGSTPSRFEEALLSAIREHPAAAGSGR